jgi:hypothetical protein
MLKSFLIVLNENFFITKITHIKKIIKIPQPNPIKDHSLIVNPFYSELNNLYTFCYRC